MAGRKTVVVLVRSPAECWKPATSRMIPPRTQIHKPTTVQFPGEAEGLGRCRGGWDASGSRGGGFAHPAHVVAHVAHTAQSVVPPPSAFRLLHYVSHPSVSPCRSASPPHASRLTHYALRITMRTKITSNSMLRQAKFVLY